MCTVATYQTKDFYMGRTLDYEFSYGEEIAVVPRRFPLEFRYGKKLDTHYAMIGMRIWQADIRCFMMRQMRRDLVWPG